MGEAGLVTTQKFTFRGLTLESGAQLGPVTVAYETYGRLSPHRNNAILVLHALTGSAHAAGKNSTQDRQPGWWDPLIGPGRALDTNKYYIICSNVLGGCYGTTGPASPNPATGRPYALDFPIVTIKDMVMVQQELLAFLGIEHLVAVIGGSMGGMQALQWAGTFPEMVDLAIPISTSGRLSAQGIAYNEVQRQAIRQDSAWRQGNYYGTRGPEQGLALARMIATITYKSDISWSFKFGRNYGSPTGDDYFRWDGRFEVENYLHYQGRKLVERFDANTYLYLTKAMDLFDLGRGFSSYSEALGNIKAITLVIGTSSDFLYPTYQQKEIVELMQRQGRRAFYAEIDSPFGHDGFLIEFAKLGKIVREFLEEFGRR